VRESRRSKRYEEINGAVLWGNLLCEYGWREYNGGIDTKAEAETSSATNGPVRRR